MKPNQQTQLEILFNQAIGLHQGGDLAGAEQLYLRILIMAPPTAVVMQMLGVARAQQGRFAEALDSVSAALKLDPHSPEAWMNNGNVLRALGRSPEALAAYDHACKLNPNYTEALYNCGLTLLEFGRHAEALQYI